MGFSKFAQIIINSKKPIVAHNSFFDFSHFYQQFIENLPNGIN
jgi:hypothetical protein